jgi:hypothetical protein
MPDAAAETTGTADPVTMMDYFISRAALTG